MICPHALTVPDKTMVGLYTLSRGLLGEPKP